MALTKTILKNSGLEVIVKWTGAGTETLTLASLVATGQTLTGTVSPGVVITGTQCSVDTTGTCVITRNSVDVLNLRNNFTFPSDSFLGVVIKEQPTSDIVVNLTTAGTLIIKLKKMQGYSAL